jgi:hypothetical protein
MSNYRKIATLSTPDCCLTCRFGDWDGEGCEVLLKHGYGATEKFLDDDFIEGFFSICDNYERAPWAKGA